MDTIYDQYIAEEKLKQGTKYEKLAAIVFKVLNETDNVVHDLTLRGDGKSAAHQIDVTVQSPHASSPNRILIECKDYDSKVGIKVVRDFFGAVHQIKPDESFIVTTEGYTQMAKKFAEDEGINLAVLRDFKEEDWEGFIKSINIRGSMITINTPTLSWVAVNKEERDKFNAMANEEKGQTQNISTYETFFYDKEGNIREDFQTVLSPIINRLPRNINTPTVGRYEFDEVKYVKMAGLLVCVRGFDYEFTSNEHVFEIAVDAGEKVALLIFKVLNGEFEKIIFEQDLDKWTFDEDGKVIQK